MQQGWSDDTPRAGRGDVFGECLKLWNLSSKWQILADGSKYLEDILKYLHLEDVHCVKPCFVQVWNRNICNIL